MAGKERVVAASLTTKLQGRGSRLMPDKVKAEMHRKMAEPGSGDDWMLPPGPQLPALAQAVAYHRDPLGVLLRARARYGSEFTLRVTKPIVFVSDAALMADPNAGEARRTVLPLASPRSLFGADGAEHGAERAWWELRFSTISDDAIAEIAERHIASWPRGRPFRLLERMRSLASDVFGRLILRSTIPTRSWRPCGGCCARPGTRRCPCRRRWTRCSSGVPRRCERSSSATAYDADRVIVVVAAGQEPPAIALTNVALRVGPSRGSSSRRRSSTRRCGCGRPLPPRCGTSTAAISRSRPCSPTVTRTRSPTRTPSAPIATTSIRCTCRSAAASGAASANRWPAPSSARSRRCSRA